MSNQPSLTNREWGRRGKVVASPRDDAGVQWKIAKQTEMLTVYKPDRAIDGVSVRVKVGSPKDRSWVVNVVFEAEFTPEQSGAALIPNLFPRDGSGGVRTWGGFQTREAAETACRRLFYNLTTEQMLEQFITGQATRVESVDQRSTEMVRTLCAPGIHRVQSVDRVEILDAVGQLTE